MYDEFPWDVVVIGGVVVASATLYGIAALWAAGSRAKWLLRAAPVALLLAAIAPIGAYEPLLMLAVQAALVVGTLLLVAFVRYRSAPHPARSQLTSDEKSPPVIRGRRLMQRFRLIDLLLAVGLTAAVFAILRFADPDPSAANQLDWFQWIMLGLGFGTGTLAAACLVSAHLPGGRSDPRCRDRRPCQRDSEFGRP